MPLQPSTAAPEALTSMAGEPPTEDGTSRHACSTLTPKPVRPPGPAAAPPSLARISSWIALGVALLVVLGASIVALTSLSVMRTADQGRDSNSKVLINELRSVAAVERLMVLGDQLVNASQRESWQGAGVAMQALVYHPAFDSIPDGLDRIRAVYSMVNDIVDLRTRIEDRQALESPSAPLPEHLAMQEIWRKHRAELQTIADNTAQGVIQRSNTLSAKIVDSALFLLTAAVAGTLLALIGTFTLMAQVRRHLLQPMISIAAYLDTLRTNQTHEGALPEPINEEVLSVNQAMSELAAAQKALQHMALHDTLTGLSNRTALQARLEQTLAEAQHRQSILALILIDLDAFKSINDTLGHAIGDLFLCEVAARISRMTSDVDTAARLGGDEFVVLLACPETPASVASWTRHLLAEIARPVCIGTHELFSSASIGISLAPSDGHNLATLLKNAEIAMYASKSQGRGLMHFFNPEMNRSTRERVRLEQDLRRALDAREFCLHYQPQISAEDGRIVGVEALIRWPQRDGRLIAPDRFIPVAEEIGLINRIGEWVLGEACTALQRWRKAGHLNLRMAVNLSALQLTDPDLHTHVRQALNLSGLPASQLELEVTETAAMTRPEITIANLKALHGLGVTLAIDDFGTGYSSLAYLKRFPLDRLKIDRTFVADIETDSSDAAICAATMHLAHSLSLEVVAEGVETAAQRDYLCQQGCDHLQGYYFSRPLSEADLLLLLRQPLPAHWQTAHDTTVPG